MPLWLYLGEVRATVTRNVLHRCAGRIWYFVSFVSSLSLYIPPFRILFTCAHASTFTCPLTCPSGSLLKRIYIYTCLSLSPSLSLYIYISIDLITYAEEKERGRGGDTQTHGFLFVCQHSIAGAM